MKTEIITLLRQRGDYVSGQELCEHFGVSRTAVWKAMEQLKKDGYVIEAVKNRGYLLKEEGAPRVFGYTEIRSRLQTAWAGQSLTFFDRTDSTNIQAKRLAEEGAPHGTVVVADAQTAGRGRRGRNWESPSGTNLYFSLLLRPDFAPEKASMLTLVMALAVARGIMEMNQANPTEKETGKQMTLQEFGKTVGIKWPNDIVVDGKKVCGILTELSLSVEMGGISHVVIGVGVNVGMQDFPEKLRDKAVSLEEVMGPINRSSLLCAILGAFETYYDKFLETGDLALLKGQYERILVNKDRNVRVLDPKGEFDGVARSITDGGELVVELPDGTERRVYAGEVSVRGIYGYV